MMILIKVSAGYNTEFLIWPLTTCPESACSSWLGCSVSDIYLFCLFAINIRISTSRWCIVVFAKWKIFLAGQKISNVAIPFLSEKRSSSSASILVHIRTGWEFSAFLLLKPSYKNISFDLSKRSEWYQREKIGNRSQMSKLWKKIK